MNTQEDRFSSSYTYQNDPLMRAIRKAIRPHLKEGERLIWRDAFRWRDKNGILRNHYEMQDIEYIAETFGYEIVHDFNHFAVIRDEA